MFSLITFLITICIVVVFHEYGHYIAARYYGIHVERFSVGFGKVLYKKTDRKGTEWVISMLPLGGYVKPMAEPTPQKPNQSIAEKTAWQKLVIYAAGPAFSFLLGIIIYTGTFMIGEDVPEAIIATPPEHSVAAKAGLMGGDKLLEINGVKVNGWSEAVDQLIEPLTLGKTSLIRVEHPSGNIEELSLAFQSFTGSLDSVNLLKEAGLLLQAPQPSIRRIIEGGPAEQAGLKVGDQIISLNGQAIEQLSTVIEQIQQSPGVPLVLGVLRNGALLQINVVPTPITLDNGRTVGRIQTEFQAHYVMSTVRYGPIDAVFKATQKTWDTAWFSLKMMGKMLIGEASLKNISGPVTIADYSGRVAEQGLMNFIQFIALISISIGVLNLLPIPALDGGQMVINFIEMIRGRPLSDSVLNVMMRLGYAFILVLMVFAFTNDLSRIFN